MAKKKLPSTVSEMKKRSELLFDALARESDRGLVLTGVTFLDEALEVLLRAKFRDRSEKPEAVVNLLFAPIGPLSSFWAKIRLAYALSLIRSWVYEDLEVLRQLRNRFAHQLEPADFDDPQVIRLTERLIGANHAAKGLSKHKTDVVEESSMPDSEKEQAIRIKKERMRTTLTISYIGGLLHCKTVIIETVSPEQAIRLFDKF